jgi:hypothetical protein
MILFNTHVGLIKRGSFSPHIIKMPLDARIKVGKGVPVISKQLASRMTQLAFITIEC